MASMPPSVRWYSGKVDGHKGDVHLFRCQLGRYLVCSGMDLEVIGSLRLIFHHGSEPDGGRALHGCDAHGRTCILCTFLMLRRFRRGWTIGGGSAAEEQTAHEREQYRCQGERCRRPGVHVKFKFHGPSIRLERYLAILQ